MSSAGICIIGNEVLSGKVEEENARFLIGELRALGVDLGRIVVIKDEVQAIASDVRALSSTYDHVFTAGGVGPTHDDVTMEGVAAALGVELVLHPTLEARFRDFYRNKVNADILRMALVPKGTVLIGEAESPYPVTAVKNIYILPGVPSFLRAKFELLRPLLAGGGRFFLQEIYVRVGEPQIAGLLRGVQEALLGLSIGSYPRFDSDEYKVKITVEAKDAGLVKSGVERILAGLDAASLVRVVDQPEEHVLAQPRGQ